MNKLGFLGDTENFFKVFKERILLVEFKQNPVLRKFNQRTRFERNTQTEKTLIESYRLELLREHEKFLEEHHEELEKIRDFTEVFNGISCRVKSQNPEIESLFRDGKILKEKLNLKALEAIRKSAEDTENLRTVISTLQAEKSIKNVVSSLLVQRSISKNDEKTQGRQEEKSKKAINSSSSESPSSSREDKNHSSKDACEKTKGKECLMDLLEKEKIKLWDRLGGPSQAGKDIIVGIVGGGIDPTHLAFSDRIDELTGEPVAAPDGVLSYGDPPSSWNGVCQTGEGWPSCSNKVIGARYYTQGWLGDDTIRFFFGQLEYVSARDSVGSTTLTTSVIAGNHKTPTSLEYPTHFSGVAPKARIAVYKVLWRDFIAFEDALAAFEDVVFDGCHVVLQPFADFPDLFQFGIIEEALKNIVASGIIIAQGAGFDGPTDQTVRATFPWLVTASGSQNPCPTQGEGLLELTSREEDILKITGKPTGPNITLIDKTITLGSSVRYPWVSEFESKIGFMDSFDPTKTIDKIVILTDLELSFSDKSLALQKAGAAGMIIVQSATEPNEFPLGGTVNPRDNTHIPTLILSISESEKLLSLFSETQTELRGTLRTRFTKKCQYRPRFSELSSRGPIRYFSFSEGLSYPYVPDLLKPDLCAVAESVVGAFTEKLYPLGYPLTPEIASSGSLGAASAVAGYACLLRQLYPSWSPMAIKSALMTTATNLKDEDPLKELSQFKQGAGYIRPNHAADPGLIFDANDLDWTSLLCESGQTDPFLCDELKNLGYPLNSRDYNNPGVFLRSLVPTTESIDRAIPRVSPQTVHRVVTNVFSRQSTYRVTSFTDGGLEILVTPSEFTLEPGQEQKLVITIRPTKTYRPATSPLCSFINCNDQQNGYNYNNVYNYGLVQLKDQHKHKVRIPVAAAFVDFYAPLFQEISFPDTIFRFNIAKDHRKFGRFSYQGLVKPEIFDVTLNGISFFGPQPDESTKTLTLNIDTETQYVRIQIFPEDLSVSDADIKCQVLNYQFAPSEFDTLIQNGISSPLTLALNNNNLSLTTPYYMRLYCANNPEPSVTFRAHVWYLKSKDFENMKVISSVPGTEAGTYEIQLRTEGLESNTHYLGRLIYDDVSDNENFFNLSTVVLIHT